MGRVRVRVRVRARARARARARVRVRARVNLLAARVGGFVAEQHCALELARVRISALALHLHPARHPSPRQEIAAHGAQAADARGVAVLEALRRVERVDPKDDECEAGELPRDGGCGLVLPVFVHDAARGDGADGEEDVVDLVRVRVRVGG